MPNGASSASCARRANHHGNLHGRLQRIDFGWRHDRDQGPPPSRNSGRRTSVAESDLGSYRERVRVEAGNRRSPRLATRLRGVPHPRRARERGLADEKNVGLVGFSHGGCAITYAMFLSKTIGYETTDFAPFAAAVAFYPLCLQDSQSYDLRAPTLMLLGAKDTWTPAEWCKKIEQRARENSTHGLPLLCERFALVGQRSAPSHSARGPRILRAVA